LELVGNFYNALGNPERHVFPFNGARSGQKKKVSGIKVL
jgi:hypothetical protein